jgi:hypothetical protein
MHCDDKCSLSWHAGLLEDRRLAKLNVVHLVTGVDV